MRFLLVLVVGLLVLAGLMALALLWGWSRWTFTRVGPLTVYPRGSAMRGALELRVPGGRLVVFPPITVDGQREPWYAYVSPDGTPQRATWAIGPGYFR